MKFTIVFAAVLAVSCAQYKPIRPLVATIPGSEQDAETIQQENDIYPDGSYKHSLKTSNGISAEAEGVPRNLGGNPPAIPIVSQGSFSWTSPEGVPVAISYIADENGYNPSGSAIPTPPPIPDAILKALDFIARNPPARK